MLAGIQFLRRSRVYAIPNCLEDGRMLSTHVKTAQRGIHGRRQDFLKDSLTPMHGSSSFLRDPLGQPTQPWAEEGTRAVPHCKEVLLHVYSSYRLVAVRRV